MNHRMNTGRIAIFLPRMAGGGAEKNLIKYANILSEHYRVSLVIGQEGGALKTELSDKFEVLRLKRSNILKTLPDWFKFLKLKKFDCVITSLHNAGNVIALAKIFSGSSIPIFFREAIAPKQAWESARFSVRVHIFAARILFRFYSGIISVSEEMVQEIASFYSLKKDRVLLVRNPVIGEDFKILMQETVKEGLPKAEKNIVAIGRMDFQKGFDMLLKSLDLLRNKFKNIHLTILGEYNKEDAYYLQIIKIIHELRLEEYVTIKGYVSNPLPYLHKADLFVLSSRYEGLPNVLIQALATGVPVVSTACKTGPTEILENGKYGRLVQVDDFHALANAMELTLEEDRQLMEKERIERGYYYHESLAAQDLFEVIKRAGL
ncbi:MAG: glycosyltransferase [Bacteroidetes bacterium]|nr:glycosyltransferase [Bacteroidota bacterium]